MSKESIIPQQVFSNNTARPFAKEPMTIYTGNSAIGVKNRFVKGLSDINT